MFARIVSSFKNNYIEYSLYFLIASLFFGSAILSIANTIFYVIVLFNIYKKIRFYEYFEIKPFLFLNLYFLVIFLILCFLSENINQVLEIEKYLPFILYPLFFFTNREELNKKDTINCVRKILVFGATITFFASFCYSLWRMFFLEENINPIYITYSFLTDLFGVHLIYLSAFYLLAIMFCLDFYYQKQYQISNKKYLFISAFLFFALILLSSRTALIASFFVIFTKIIILNKKNIKRIILIMFSIIFLGSVLIFCIPILKERVVNINKNVSSYSGISLRIKIWENAIEVFKKSPIYGYGISNSQDVLLNQYHQVNFRRAFLKNFNAHNQYLQSLIDSGVIGLIFLILMLMSPILFFRNKTNFILFTILILITLIPESFFITSK